MLTDCTPNAWRPRSILVGAWLFTALGAASSAQDDVNELIEAGNQAREEKRYGDAGEIYARVADMVPVEEVPGLLMVLWITGGELYSSGQHAKAIAPLQKVAEASRNDPIAHLWLGESLSRLGRHAEAIAPLRIAMQLMPQHRYAHIYLGESLMAVNEYEQAAAVWGALRNVDWGSPHAYGGLVRVHEVFAALASHTLHYQHTESPYLARLDGWRYLEEGEYPLALEAFRDALEVEPDVRAVHEALALVYEKAGRPEWADIERAKAAALPELNCDGVESAACNFVAGRFDRIPDGLPSLPSSLYWAARSHDSLAQRAFEHLKSLPESVHQLSVLASVLDGRMRYAEAADACRRALELGRESDWRVAALGTDPAVQTRDPDLEEPLERQLAELLYHADRTQEARPLLTRFHESDPDDPRWAEMLGNLLTDEGEFEKAIPVLESALAQTDEPFSVRIDLGRSYIALGQPEKALPHLKALVDQDLTGSVHYQLAQAYQHLASEALAKHKSLEARLFQGARNPADLELVPPN